MKRTRECVRVDIICAMHEKAMNCKITLCMCVCEYIYIYIYFNRSVAIKLVDSKTNGFLFLRENYRYRPDYLNFGTNGIRSNVNGF